MRILSFLSVNRNYILNRLDDSLYNVYSPITTAKKLWASLDKKYKTEERVTDPNILLSIIISVWLSYIILVLTWSMSSKYVDRLLVLKILIVISSKKKEYIVY